MALNEDIKFIEEEKKSGSKIKVYYLSSCLHLCETDLAISWRNEQAPPVFSIVGKT